ncbi:MAG: ABC transporter substrate-binding protein [Microcella sp.]|uniref:ABC transporter substrate-binding protein n=1 Tax=Microcella sp. TaxID=1913979 RepID=UPI0033151A7F
MHRRRVTALALSLGLVAALGACATGEEAAGGVVELDYWTQNDSGPPLELDQALVADFNAEHPDIQVNLRSISNASFFTVMRNAFTAGDPPEIFVHEGNNNLFQFVTNGDGVLDITDWFEQPGNGDRFVEGTAGNVTYDGRVYGVPGGLVTTDTIFYNKAILEPYGIDPSTFTTWQEYLDAFAVLEADGIDPIAYGNSEGWPGSQWFYQFLAKEVGAEQALQLVAGNCGYQWTDPEVVAAAQLYVDLSEAGYFTAGEASDDWNTAQAAFSAGIAPFFATGSWLIPQLTELPNADDFGVARFPGTAGSENPNDLLISVGGHAISKSADTPEKEAAALTFISWLYDVPQQERNVGIGSVSTVLGANDGVLPLMAQVVSQSLDTSTGSIPFLEHVLPKEVGEDAIWNGSVAVLTGQATAQSWMESVQAAADATTPTLALVESCG